jgi:hypothetical protein
LGTASTALNSASAGIKTIATSLLTGQAAPASARDQVGTGLKNALSALSTVTGVYYFFGVELMEGIRPGLRLKLMLLFLLERMLSQTVSEKPVEGHAARKNRTERLGRSGRYFDS